MADNRIYKSPEAMQVEPNELSAEARRVLAEELICRLGENPHLHELTEQYRLVFMLEGKWVETSEPFCTLVGYTNSQVLAKTLRDLTAPGTVNVAKHLGAVFQCSNATTCRDFGCAREDNDQHDASAAGETCSPT